MLRYNVFDRNYGAMLVFRKGDRNVAYGNVFVRGSGGIRIKEANDVVCYNNYFDACPQALTVDYLDTSFVNNITFLHNTFVNTSFDLTSLLISKSKKKILLQNNLFNQFKFGVSRKDFLNQALDFEGNAFDQKEEFTELKKLSTNKNLFVLNETFFRAKTSRNLKFFGLTKSLSVVLSKSKTMVPFYLTNMVDLNEDINQVVIRGEKLKRDIGCEQFIANHGNNSSPTTTFFKNLNIRRGPSYLTAPLVV